MLFAYKPQEPTAVDTGESVRAQKLGHVYFPFTTSHEAHLSDVKKVHLCDIASFLEAKLRFKQAFCASDQPQFKPRPASDSALVALILGMGFRTQLRPPSIPACLGQRASVPSRCYGPGSPGALEPLPSQQEGGHGASQPSGDGVRAKTSGCSGEREPRTNSLLFIRFRVWQPKQTHVSNS